MADRPEELEARRGLGGGTPQPGDVLDGRYRLVVRIGRGGFGDVWRAEELLPDGAPFREVALKLLVAGVADVVSWSEEAKFLASFRHPSLVTIYSAGILELGTPQPFVSMELLEGETLGDRIKARGRIPWRRVLRWARDVAAALDVIHRRGVVHLDLKPANLFLAADGAIKVLDFGIARRSGGPQSVRGAPPAYRIMADDPGLETAMFVAAHEEDAFAATRKADGTTTRRAVIGTPGYMAPEVIENLEPSAATDAYALAVCIVQLTTGRFPQAVDAEPEWSDPSAISAWIDRMRAATLRGELRDLAADPAGLPRALVALLGRLLTIDPAQRRLTPGSLRELLDEVWETPYGVSDPPYTGLEPYGCEAEGLLFGRDDDATRLGRELEFVPCLVLQGARGTGKTSLARAGLVPFLARRATDDADDWRALEIRPGEDPEAALTAALASLDPELAEASAEELTAWCARSPIGVLLIVDPLHELLAAPELRRARLIRLLSALAEGNTRPRLRVVGCVREEHTGALLAVFDAAAAIRASLRFVGAPTAAAVDDIAGGPARLAGAKVTGLDLVAGDIQRELRADARRLPFVALALRAWWGKRETDKGGAVVLRGQAWRGLGGVTGALARHADAALERMPPEMRVTADEILARLSATDGALVRWSEPELLAAVGGEASDAERASAAVAALADAYLVRRSEGAIEVAHEALLSSWPHLHAVRLAAMERLVFLERLRDAAEAWDRSGNHPDFVWRGTLLKEMAERQGWLARGLSERERTFVDESRRRERWRRLSRLGIFGALGLVVVLGVVAKQAADEQRAADERARREAEGHAYLAEAIAKSRRTEDPFVRAAWIAEAMREGAEQGSVDGALPLDLAGAVANVPRAHFLTLDDVTAPAFFWDDRWLVGSGSGATLTVVDFKPPDPDVIENVDIDVDPEKIKLKGFREPRVMTLTPHADPIVQKVPFAFDTSLVTRSVGGEVRIWRMRDNGTVALAAVAPMRCRGAVHTADAAPVVACETDEGLARWDLRRMRGKSDGGASSVDRHPFQGNVLDVSADGERVGAVIGRRVLLWSPGASRVVEFNAADPVVLGRWSPRDRVMALLEIRDIELADMDRPSEPLMTLKAGKGATSLRWDDGGLDLGVCASGERGHWQYLRAGGRAETDIVPTGDPCLAPPKGKKLPEPLRTVRDFPPYADLDVGPHLLTGGWKLPDGRHVSRDLVLFAAPQAVAVDLLRFHGRDPMGTDEERAPNESIAAVLREGEGSVAWQVGEAIHLYGVGDGKRVLSRKGNLVGRCDDGRLVAWRREEASWRVFDVRSDATLATVAREPGLVIGVDRPCTTLYTQRLDGTLVATRFDASPPAGRALALADGYVYDARTTAGGILLALSSGAVARIDGKTEAVRVVAYATPRATAIGDGPGEGDVIFADATGVVLVRASGSAQRVLEAQGASTWEDLSIARDGKSMLLASSDKIGVLDLGLHEIVGSIAVERKGRFAPWDADGSVLAWSYGRAGGPDGQIVPRGLALARRISETVSNLTVDHRRLALRRK